MKGALYLIAKDGYHALRIILKSKGSKGKKLKVLFGGVKDGFSFRPEIRYLKESNNG